MDKIKAFLYSLIFRRSLYVVMDPKDNSVTFSKRLCKHIGIDNLKDKAKVFVFRMPFTGIYGFEINTPELPSYAAVADIQYNTKYHCVGFESLVPTVNRILYDYRLPHDCKAKLYVYDASFDERKYYIIKRPHAKIFR